MDDIKLFKEKMINDYIYNVDLSTIGTNELKYGLKSILGEEPGIKYVYKEQIKLNEATGKTERLPNELNAIEIYFTYIGSDNMPHSSHMKYIIN